MHLGSTNVMVPSALCRDRNSVGADTPLMSMHTGELVTCGGKPTGRSFDRDGSRGAGGGDSPGRLRFTEPPMMLARRLNVPRAWVAPQTNSDGGHSLPPLSLSFLTSQWGQHGLLSDGQPARLQRDCRSSSSTRSVLRNVRTLPLPPSLCQGTGQDI